MNVTVEGYKKERWPKQLEDLRTRIPDAQSHSTSPFIYEGCDKRDLKFVGGYNEFFELARRQHGKNERS